MRKLWMIPVAAVLAVSLTACPSENKTPTKTTQADKALKAAESITFTANAEIDNIKRRLELTSDPGLVGYVVLFNDVGTPILYTGVIGKITSSGKRLTPKQEMRSGDRGNYFGDFVVDAPSDEGTHGSSSPYIYFWTPSGQYIQWSGNYLYSDKPLRLDSTAVVVKLDEGSE